MTTEKCNPGRYCYVQGDADNKHCFDTPKHAQTEQAPAGEGSGTMGESDNHDGDDNHDMAAGSAMGESDNHDGDNNHGESDNHDGDNVVRLIEDDAEEAQTRPSANRRLLQAADSFTSGTTNAE